LNQSVVIYPRGFAGFDIGLPIRVIKPTQQQILNSVLHHRNLNRANKAVISNTDVESLWKQLTSGDRFVNSFAFRESILIAGLKSFGTLDFLKWVQLQEENPYLGPNHIRFINDTLGYINGSPRSLNIQNWLILLAGEKPTTDSVKINVEEFFRTNKPIHMRQNPSLKEHLINWTRRPGGFEDLLGTMHILFGDSEIL
jgi:hypothetical protein